VIKPEDLSRYADKITLLYRDLEDDIIRDMTARLARSGFTESTVWQIERLQDMGAVSNDVFARFAQTARVREDVLREAFEDAGGKVAGFKDSLGKQIGLAPELFGMTSTMQSTLMAGLKTISGNILNLTGTTATGMSNAYYSLSNRAYMQVMSGTMSHDQAIRQAVADLAQHGVHTATYTTRGSRRDQIDVAVRRNVLTGVNQTVARMQFDAMEDLGTDLVETSAHATARPAHQLWQGRVFVVQESGGAMRNGIHFDNFYRETRYGEVDGLCGINCRHGFWPFVVGVSTRAYSERALQDMRDATVEIGGEVIPVYEASQRQRDMENSIRATKRELVGLDTLMLEADGDSYNYFRMEFNNTAAKLKKQEGALGAFAEQSGFGLYRDRTTMPGFTRSTSAKAVWGARRAAGQ